MTTATTATATRTGPWRWLRRHRSAVVIGAALVTATVLAVVGGSGEQYTGGLDPRNAKPAGAQAVAEVLEDQGIDVQVVRNAAAFDDARVDVGTTVLITSTENLGRTTAGRVRDRARGTEIVLVGPGLGIAEFFGAQEGDSYSRTRKVEAGCSDGLYAGLSAETRAGSVFPTIDGSCFATDGGALLSRPTTGVTILGAADLLSNEQVTRSDNAAIALRLLGQRDRLVWYVPDPTDLTGDDPVSFGSLLPDWLRPGLVLGCAAVLALVLWRGRRLGPLAVEPLPVAVTAIETTRSRGRLYRKADDRGYAAEALRRSARTELTEHLLLGRYAAADVDLLARMLAPHTSLEQGRLRDLLSPTAPVPSSDRELITLANDLAALSREVRRP